MNRIELAALLTSTALLLPGSARGGDETKPQARVANPQVVSQQSAAKLKIATKIVIGDVALVYNEGKNPGPGVAVVAIHLERDYDGRKIPGSVKVKVNGTLTNTVSEPLTNITPPGSGPWSFECSFDGNESYLPTSASRTLHR